MLVIATDGKTAAGMMHYAGARRVAQRKRCEVSGHDFTADAAVCWDCGALQPGSYFVERGRKAIAKAIRENRGW